MNITRIEEKKEIQIINQDPIEVILFVNVAVQNTILEASARNVLIEN
jgi:hypothetical protein